MRKIASALMLVGCALATQAQAQAVSAGDAEARVTALSHCLAMKSSGQDRETLAKWMLGGLAGTPLSKGLVTLDPASKVQVDKDMARVFERLMTVDCLAEIQAIAKAGDTHGVERGFQTLGQIAMQDVMRDPAVGDSLGAVMNYISPDALKNLAP